MRYNWDKHRIPIGRFGNRKFVKGRSRMSIHYADNVIKETYKNETDGKVFRWLAMALLWCVNMAIMYIVDVRMGAVTWHFESFGFNWYILLLRAFLSFLLVLIMFNIPIKKEA